MNYYEKKTIYINGIFYEYISIYSYENKISFLIDKRYANVFPVKANSIIFQHGMDYTNKSDLYWFLIDNPISYTIRNCYNWYECLPYFELTICGEREKINELMVLRDLKLNEYEI